MSEWKKTTLGEIADIEMGQSPKGETCNTIGNGIPLLNGPTEFKIKNPKAVQYTIDSKRECRPLDLLFCVRGSTGRMNWADKRYSIGRGLAAIRHKSGSEYRCFLRGIIDYNLKVLLSSATGSIFSNITKKQLENLEIKLPPLSEQKSIASVLSSLDDKIDLLHRQNATLEKMAETLFRQWFVERCPEPVEGEEKEEWEIKKLGAIAEIQNGFAFSSKDYVEYADTHLEVFKMGHIQKGGGLRTDPKRDYVPRSERLKRWILNKGDIVMAMTDMKDNVVILGVPAMIDKDDNYVLNQRVARIYLKDKSNLISNYLLFIQLKDVDFIQELQSKANSGVQVNLSTESIKDSDIIIPPLAIQKEKSPIIDDLYTKVELNQTQIRTLTALRDTLLPKLMSGEVRVEE